MFASRCMHKGTRTLWPELTAPSLTQVLKLEVEALKVKLKAKEVELATHELLLSTQAAPLECAIDVVQRLEQHRETLDGIIVEHEASP